MSQIYGRQEKSSDPSQGDHTSPEQTERWSRATTAHTQPNRISAALLIVLARFLGGWKGELKLKITYVVFKDGLVLRDTTFIKMRILTMTVRKLWQVATGNCHLKISGCIPRQNAIVFPVENYPKMRVAYRSPFNALPKGPARCKCGDKQMGLALPRIDLPGLLIRLG